MVIKLIYLYIYIYIFDCINNYKIHKKYTHLTLTYYYINSLMTCIFRGVLQNKQNFVNWNNWMTLFLAYKCIPYDYVQ